MQNLPTGTVTFLFMDIEGSTRLLQRLGDLYGTVLAEYRQLLRTLIHNWQGYEVDTQGDSFFFSFTRAADAVAAAAEAQRTLFEHIFSCNVTIYVRMGIHTGEPGLGPEGYIGLAVHHAARIMSAGHGGQVLLSQTTRNLLEHDLPTNVRLKDVGIHQLKDIPEPDHLYQLVIGELPATFPPLKTQGTPHRLFGFPEQLTSFVGREQELTTLTTYLKHADIHLLTLTGTAGVGKTRLAIKTATEVTALFDDGIYLIPLDQVTTVEAMIPTIITAIGIREEHDTTPLHLLKQTLQQRCALLMLDSVEQVADAALQLTELLASCPQLKIMVTSRERLHVQAEHVFDVHPLAVPPTVLPREPDILTLTHQYEAIDLFQQRAQAIKPDFQLSQENISAVMQICARLDGLPLAIELAAARVKYMQPDTLLMQLEQGLKSLKVNARDVPSRQQTLYSALAWSYNRLEDEQQQLFRRLAVFSDGGTLPAIQSICHQPTPFISDIEELLEALLDKSLLQQEEVIGEESRFILLRTLREYAQLCLHNAQEDTALSEAHANYYLQFAEEAAQKLRSTDKVIWLDRIEQEHENLRTALSWFLVQAPQKHANAERAIQFCTALLSFWEIRGYFQEAHTFVEQALLACKHTTAVLRAQILYMAGFLAILQDEAELGQQRLEESLALYRTLSDTAGTAKALRLLGQQQAMETTSRARLLLEEAFTHYQQLGDQNGQVLTRYDLARVMITQRDYTRAQTLLEEALLLIKAQNPTSTYKAYPMKLLAELLFLAKSDLQRAWQLNEECLTLFKIDRNRRFIAYALNSSADLLLETGDIEKAHERSEESLSLFREVGYRSGIIESLITRGRIYHTAGDYAHALASYQEAWQLLQKNREKTLWAFCLEELGKLAAEEQQDSIAAQLWGKAAMLRASLLAPMPRVYKQAYEQALGVVRSRLGKESFQAAWSQGRQLSLTQFPSQLALSQAAFER